jgi:cell division protein FtsL
MRKITKKDKRRLLIWTLLIVIIMSYLTVFSFNYWSKIFSNRKEAEELKEQYENLLQEEEELNSQITKLEDPDYVAEYAREKYMLSKDGEIIIKVPDDVEN